MRGVFTCSCLILASSGVDIPSRLMFDDQAPTPRDQNEKEERIAATGPYYFHVSGAVAGVMRYFFQWLAPTATSVGRLTAATSRFTPFV